MNKGLNKKGMDVSEIKNKLSVLKSDDGKINYLESIQRRIGATSPLTQKSFYETLGDLYLGKENFESAIKMFSKAGEEKKLSEAYLKAGKNEKNLTHAFNYYNKANLKGAEAEKEWKEFGDRAFDEQIYMEMANESYKKAGIDKSQKIKQKWISLGDGMRIGDAGGSAKTYYDYAGLSNSEIDEKFKEGGDENLKRGDFRNAAILYERAGVNENKDIDALRNLSKAYEMDGKPNKAITVQKRIERIKNKSMLERKVANFVFGVLTLGGLFFGFRGITGAVIGSSKNISLSLGVVGFVGGIVGLLLTKK